MLVMQSATITGSVIRHSIRAAYDTAKELTTGFKSVKKFGMFKRKKVRTENLAEFDKIFSESFIFQTYLSICRSEEDIVNTYTLATSLNFRRIAENCMDELKARKIEGEFDLTARTNGLATYLAFLKYSGYYNAPLVKLGSEPDSFSVYAPDVKSLLTGGRK